MNFKVILKLSKFNAKMTNITISLKNKRVEISTYA